MSALPLPSSQIQSEHVLAPRAGVIGKAGVIAFIASSSVLFGSLLVAYLIGRSRIAIPMPAIPWALWLGTGIVLVSSLILEYAIRSAYLNHTTAAYRALLGATGLTYLFFAVQATGVVMLFQLSLPFRGTSELLFALTVALMVLHLIHALGALIGLTIASLQSEKHHYTSETIGVIRPLSIYCHFLTAVWMVIFCVLIFANL